MDTETIHTSVIILAYNPDKAKLKRAVNSILEQITDFKIEVLIVDDTEKVDFEYFKEVKHYFMPLIYGKRIGLIRSLIFAVKQAKGDYIAFCDSDDHFSMVSKLELQAKYMQLNSDCGLCVTDCIVLKKGYLIPKVLKQKLNYANLLTGNFLFACTFYLKKELINIDLLSELDRKNIALWDYALALDIAKRSKIGHIKHFTATYSINGTSATHTENRLKRAKHILKVNQLRLMFINKYGCKWSTKWYLIYKFTRDIYSIIFKRWTKKG